MQPLDRNRGFGSDYERDGDDPEAFGDLVDPIEKPAIVEDDEQVDQPLADDQPIEVESITIDEMLEPAPAFAAAA